MQIKPFTIAIYTGLALSGSLAQAEPFVFQGQLNDAGAPADGLYDLRFVLFPAVTGGTQIGPTVTIDDQQVTDGTFQVELDFGDDAFSGSTRWIEIGVRPGASGGAYTGLTPRAKVGSAPQASFATKAGVADQLSDPFWTSPAPGILMIGEQEGNDQVFVNFNRAIEPTDVLVVHSAANAPGGMTVSTWRNGMPYYSYSTGGFMRAKTYYDKLTDAWVVNKGGDQLEIDADNNVVITNDLIVGGTITALGGGGGGDSHTDYKAYTPDSIFSGFGFDRVYNAVAGAIVAAGSNSYLRSELSLPHNAQITNIRLEFVDRTNSTNIRVQLWTRNMVTLDYTTTTLMESTGSDLNMVQVMDIVPSPPIIMDNTVATYALRIFSTSGTWPTAGLLGVRNILVEYTVPY